MTIVIIIIDHKVRVIIPKSGVNQEYDDLHEQIEQREKDFNTYLLQKKKELKYVLLVFFLLYYNYII